MDSIRLGVTWDNEFNKRGVTSVEDVDDGLSYVPILTPYGNYYPQVKVYNHSGANATLIAWLDYNANGVFDASEAIAPITVPSSTSYQLFYLYWPAVPTSLPIGSSTYMRIRISASAMTSTDATGFFFTGEVEDYKVNVDNYPLGITGLSFEARLVNNKTADLSWTATEDANYGGYEIERSSNSSTWERLALVASDGKSGNHSYRFADDHPFSGKSFYRIKYQGSGKYQYSEIRSVTITNPADGVRIVPNPVSGGSTTVYLDSGNDGTVEMKLFNAAGTMIMSQNYPVKAGSNMLNISLNKLPHGAYVVQLNTVSGEQINKQLIINK
jgi:hypothetical protein